ncbi:cysteine-tryptophan domain-containing zinc finger protein 7-like [Bidens hawaiensis]|uniref:cysteine-tryptophan domain-containing zinc finger protein 7-like n=1 Tax=Bidens hawaiensis TaxID=980011 RepID=UPI0040490FB0
MFSFGSRDEKMELGAEIEEGEAYDNNNNDDSTIDPDVSLSYIDEKIQNILGDCQKDFEGGYSAENLGAKFGDYGSFLPTYQRSPVYPNPNTRPKDLNHSAPVSPYNAPIKVDNQNSVSQSKASRVRNGSAPRKSKSNGKLKLEVNTSSGKKSKSKSISEFADNPDPNFLKVRIKMASEDNMLSRKNAEIYSGLGLDMSPSSSLEASPVNSDGFFHGPHDVPDESPTSILEMMTSFPLSGSHLLSPLPYEVLHLSEKKSEDNSCGPVHKGSQDSTVTAVHGSDMVKVEQNITGEKSKSTEKNSVSMESTNGVLPKKETSVDNFALGNNTSSSGGKRKAEGGLKTESFRSKTKKNDNRSKSHTEDYKKNNEKVIETYKDFFGELDLDQEDHEEMGLEKPLEDINVKRTPENNSSLNERSTGKKSQKPSSTRIVNGPESDAAASTVAPVVNEDWVCCDRCEKWRLLPPGVNPGSLPEKWICSMLDWLWPGMNRCSISEEETTKAITSHFPGPSVQGSQPVHPSGPHLAVNSFDGTSQHLSSQIPPSGVKKKVASTDLPDEDKRDGPSMSSNSSKKKLHTSHKTRSLNGVNQSLVVNEVAFQDSGHSRDVIVDKDKLKQKENNKLRENFADEGSKIHHSKTGNKRESSQDFPKNFKKVKTDGNGGSSHAGKLDKRDIAKKRKRINEIDGTGTHVKEASEKTNTKEKKAGVLKSFDEGTSGSKVKNIKDVKSSHPPRQNTAQAATSSSSKVSGSHKRKPNNRESKGSPVESVSSSPMRILNIKSVDHHLTNNVDSQPHEEKSKGGRNKSKELLLNKNVIQDSNKDSKKPSKKDALIKEKSNPLPPTGQGETERKKENAGNNNNMPSKALKHNKKAQNPNGNQQSNVKNPTPEKPKDKSQDPTVVLVRDLSNQATTNALREATNLKHMADRVKNAGSSLESRALYIEAALKFLHVASLFESCHSQTGRYGDMIQSVSIYSSTAKLCEYCAHEYERTKENTTASLAYKCMEVAYMKVVYSSHSTACKDVNELQTSIGPTGEFPSSSASASDLDNLNNLAAADKSAIVKGVNQVAVNHVIAAKNKPSFTRILNFTQNVNSAMEASRKSRISFAACNTKDADVLSSIKRALDFNFHDVEGLLHWVRVAMEVINR